MSQSLNQIAIVVKDYDEAIKFYTEKLGFILYEDKVMNETKRWVVVGPKDSACKLLLAKAVGEEQSSRIGNQTGGRVFLFLYTTDFENEYNFMKSKGVVIPGDIESKMFYRMNPASPNYLGTSPMPLDGALDIVSRKAVEQWILSGAKNN